MRIIFCEGGLFLFLLSFHSLPSSLHMCSLTHFFTPCVQQLLAFKRIWSYICICGANISHNHGGCANAWMGRGIVGTTCIYPVCVQVNSVLLGLSLRSLWKSDLGSSVQNIDSKAHSNSFKLARCNTLHTALTERSRRHSTVACRHYIHMIILHQLMQYFT